MALTIKIQKCGKAWGSLELRLGILPLVHRKFFQIFKEK
jgi:hypothetical protein